MRYLSMQLVQEVAALNLFDIFKNYIAGQAVLSPQDHLIHLRHYGDIFRKFYSDRRDDPDGLFFYRTAEVK